MLPEIYSKEWYSYIPPQIPEKFNPTELFLDEKITKSPNKTALIIDDQVLTFKELLWEVSRASNVIRELGTHRRGIVMIVSFDSVDAITLWMGAVRIGMIPLWVSPLYSKEQLEYFAHVTEPELIFIDRTYINTLNDQHSGIPSKIIAINGRSQGVDDYDSLRRRSSPNSEPTPLHKDDPAYLLLSGGTTGKPKVVVHIARDFINVPHRHSKFMDWRGDDIHYATSPKYFTHGIWPGVLIPLTNGATAVLASGRPNINVMVDIIERHGPTVLITVPTVIKWLLDLNPEVRPNMRNIRMVISASEKLPQLLQDKFKEIYGVEVFDSIGSSEITYEWISNRPGYNKSGTTGKPIFGVEVKLIDPETGEEVKEPNKVGEVWVKSDTNAILYLRDVEKTRRTIIGEWIRTGDTMYFDEEGYFIHVGRTDDLFKVHGMWVSPLEIEEVLLKHPHVVEAAVTWGKDENGLNSPVAFVVLKKGIAITPQLEAELKEMIKRELGGYKVPYHIIQLKELPRTVLLKLDRKKLRELLNSISVNQ